MWGGCKQQQSPQDRYRRGAVAGCRLGSRVRGELAVHPTCAGCSCPLPAFKMLSTWMAGLLCYLGRDEGDVEVPLVQAWG
jgi:hypothetical protein